MKYYVTADIHGFYTLFRNALAEAGYFDDPEEHKLIILGDLFDRGGEAPALQDFILTLMKEDGVILIRGNHEDLFETFVTADEGRAYSHHVRNGTFDTALQLTRIDRIMAKMDRRGLAAAGRRTPYYQTIIPAMRDYFETERRIFTHGWLPCEYENGVCRYIPDWREASPEQWAAARWYNGMDMAGSWKEEKTVVCGHWHASYGHAGFERKGTEFGPDADFSPYYGDRIIAMDACTAESGRVNVLVLED